VNAPALATEDVLSETVGKQLLARYWMEPGETYRREGAGYLRSRAQSWCELARHRPLVLITDLDRKPCASALIEEWFRRYKPPKNLIIRVAVREIESWLLADHEGMSKLLGRACLARLPRDPDSLPDPKARLIDLARKASRSVRDDLIASTGSAARQGVGYNARLSEFVAADWSLDRANARLHDLSRRWKG
jgi:hypothetical protein